MNSSNFRQKARDALSGKWILAVIAGLIASVLGATVGTSSGSVSFDFSTEDFEGVDMEAAFSALGITPQIITAVLAVIGFFAAIGLIYSVIIFVIGSPVAIGYAQFNLDLVDGKEGTIGSMFGRFNQMKDAIISRFLRGLFVFFWSLLFVIPGIIASYSYAMTDFVLAENPGMSARDAINESKNLMEGNRWRLFCLEFSFIGWAILAVLTLGIGSLWLTPYVQASLAAFYREIKREKHPEMNIPEMNIPEEKPTVIISEEDPEEKFEA